MLPKTANKRISEKTHGQNSFRKSRQRNQSFRGKRVQKRTDFMPSLWKQLHSKFNSYFKFTNKLQKNRFQRDSLKAHVDRKHLNVKNFFCDLCPFGGYHKYHIVNHMMAVHLSIRNFQCKICSRRKLEDYLKHFQSLIFPQCIFQGFQVLQLQETIIFQLTEKRRTTRRTFVSTARKISEEKCI